jgi:hypothetical protein
MLENIPGASEFLADNESSADEGAGGGLLGSKIPDLLGGEED